MSTSPSSQASAPPESAPGGAVAVLTAAGSGSRLGAGVPKALVPVGGVSLLRRAAAGLIASGVVSHVVVTAPAGEVDRFRAELEGLPDGSVGASAGRRGEIEVVAGSPRSRQASVALGLAAALAAVPQADVVIVHDAARALTPPEVTQRVVAAVRAGHVAVVPALPVAVQTPQGFSTPVLVAAHRAGAERAGDEALAASDDAGLVEACGGSVVVVAGDERAMKVTTPMDLALAELLLERQSAQGERPAGTGGEN